MNEAALLIALTGLAIVAAVVVLLDKITAADPDSETWEQ
jgi:hypothetical protein